MLAQLVKALQVVAGLTKPKQTLLLLISMYAAYLLGGAPPRAEEHLKVLCIGALAIASVTAINMYFDRDLDALMNRTKNRPLPSGKCSPATALVFAGTAFTASLALALLYVNLYFALAVLLGFIFDIAAYTILLKRRTYVSIVAGSVAGGMPALGGWAAATGSLSAEGVLLSMLVSAWVPAHIWFLATVYREDYARAGVPMLPAVGDPTSVAQGIAMGALFQAYAVACLYLLNALGPLALVAGMAMSIRMFYLATLYSIRRGEACLAKKAFKEVNILLGLFYALAVMEKYLKAPPLF